MFSDLQWGCDFLCTFNGVVPILEERAYTPVSIDACSTGAGGVYGSQWYHVAWRDCPSVESLHINHLEVLALEPAARLFGAAWRNRQVTVYSDNQAAVAIINKGSTRSRVVIVSCRGRWPRLAIPTHPHRQCFDRLSALTSSLTTSLHSGFGVVSATGLQ